MESFRTIPSTRITLVERVTSTDPSIASAALKEMLTIYLPAITAYAVKRGIPWADAEDLTQSFLAKETWLVPIHNSYEAKNRRVSLRAMIIASFKQHLCDKWYRPRARHQELSLDSQGAPILIDNRTADRAFDKTWLAASLNRALESTLLDYQADAKTASLVSWSELLPHVLRARDGETGSQKELAVRIGIPEGTLKPLVTYWRSRLQDHIRATTADTLLDQSPQGIQLEMEQLNASWHDDHAENA